MLGGVDHLHQIQPPLRGQRRFPSGGEGIAALLQRDETGEMVRLAAHVRGALHVVLTAQRIHAGAGLAEVSGEQCEIDQRHHALGALDVLGHAEAVKRHRRGAGRVDPRRFADVLRVHAADFRRAFRRPLADEFAKLRVAAHPLVQGVLICQ